MLVLSRCCFYSCHATSLFPPGVSIHHPKVHLLIQYPYRSEWCKVSQLSWLPSHALALHPKQVPLRLIREEDLPASASAVSSQPLSALSLYGEPGTPVLTSFSWAIAFMNFSVYQRELILVPFCSESSLAPRQIYLPMPQWPTLHTRVYWEDRCCQSIKGSDYHPPVSRTILQIRAPGWYWHYYKNNIKFPLIYESLSFTSTGTVFLLFTNICPMSKELPGRYRC